MPRSVEGRFVVIGLGGVGGLVLRLLVPFLHALARALGLQPTVLAIDGDAFEEANRARQLFGDLGPKAPVLCGELADTYGDRVRLVPVPQFVTEANAARLIGEGDLVFCQPDNHATRRLVEQRCASLRDVVLISGGNDGVDANGGGTFGNVQIYERRAGRDVTNPLSAFHPEIAEPADALPTDAGCAAASASAPQLLFTNAAVASAMLSAFYAWREETLDYEEAYLDIARGRCTPVRRKLVDPGERR